MSTYVMSDIHGCYTEYLKMLKKIKFDPKKDELIIAGDIIDRGPENLEMLRYMESEPESVIFLMGNHDYDFKEYCEALVYLRDSGKVPDYSGIRSLLKSEYYPFYVIDHYGTVRNLIEVYDELTLDDFVKWGELIRELPYFVSRNVNGRMYIIVHAGYITDQEFSEYRMRGGKCRKSRTTFFIWARDESVYYGRNDSTIIFGHTPTIARESLFYNDGKVWYHEDERKNCRFFNIDCGLVWGKLYPEDKGNLACIRLEDEKVFYLYG